jgi:hypothetical protein
MGAGVSEPTAPTVSKPRALRIVMAILALSFVSWSLYGLVKRWDGASLHVDWALVAIGSIPLAIGVALQAVVWTYFARRLAEKQLPFGPSVALYMESMLARYLPGKVGLVVVRVAGGPSIGMSGKLVAVSILLEMLSFTAVGGMVGSLALAVSPNRDAIVGALGSWVWVLVAGFTFSLVVLLATDRKHLPVRVKKFLGVEGTTGVLLPWWLPIAHVGYWSTWVIHGYLTTMAVGAPSGLALAAAGLYALAVLAGFLAVVAPAGAGVREAVISLALAPVVGSAAALAAVVISRIGSVIMDVVVWLLSRPLAFEKR